MIMVELTKDKHTKIMKAIHCILDKAAFLEEYLDYDFKEVEQPKRYRSRYV